MDLPVHDRSGAEWQVRFHLLHDQKSQQPGHKIACSGSGRKYVRVLLGFTFSREQGEKRQELCVTKKALDWNSCSLFKVQRMLEVGDSKGSETGLIVKRRGRELTTVEMDWLSNRRMFQLGRSGKIPKTACGCCVVFTV